MGTMHREVIKRRKATTIIMSIVFLCVMVSMAKSVGDFKINKISVEVITDPIFMVITLYFLFFEIFQCKIRYKYSIIADQLIIHKIKSEKQKTLENIKMSNIVYIGTEKNECKKYKTKSSSRYICNRIKSRTYCCIYEKDNKYGKFYFQPSEELIGKINRFATNTVRANL